MKDSKATTVVGSQGKTLADAADRNKKQSALVVPSPKSKRKVTHSAFNARLKLDHYNPLSIFINPDNNSFACGIFVDKSKAFDILDHSVLITKLRHYGICGTALNWFTSYVSHRQQYIQFDNKSSGLLYIILYLYLTFILHVNHIFLMCEFD